MRRAGENEGEELILSPSAIEAIHELVEVSLEVVPPKDPILSESQSLIELPPPPFDARQASGVGATVRSDGAGTLQP